MWAHHSLERAWDYIYQWFYLSFHAGDNKEWDRFLRGRCHKWQTHFTSWIITSKNHPILVVRYEDLKDNTLGEMERMLDFLGFAYTREELARRLEKGYTAFKRTNHGNFEHYTQEQKKYIQKLVRGAVETLSSEGLRGIQLSHWIRDYM